MLGLSLFTVDLFAEFTSTGFLQSLGSKFATLGVSPIGLSLGSLKALFSDLVCAAIRRGSYFFSTTS